MHNVWNFLVAHRVTDVLVVGYLWSAFIGALPAPTASSSTFYRFSFSFFNLLAANIARAKSTAVEGSPNFQAAVMKQQNGGQNVQAPK